MKFPNDTLERVGLIVILIALAFIAYISWGFLSN
jgi:hypothetical protein